MDGRLKRLARKRTTWIGFSDAQQVQLTKADGYLIQCVLNFSYSRFNPVLSSRKATGSGLMVQLTDTGRGGVAQSLITSVAVNIVQQLIGQVNDKTNKTSYKQHATVISD